MSIETYLDRLFDLLGGTGAAGRRAVAEAESHLTEAVEALVVGGLTREAAEAEAVRRFGSPETVAAAHLKAGALPPPAVVQRLFAAGWLMTGVGGVAYGLSGLLAYGVARLFGENLVAPDAPDAVFTAERCAQLFAMNPDAANCRTASVVHHLDELTFQPMEVGVVALVLLAVFLAARKVPGLRLLTRLPGPAMVSAVGATVFGGAGVMFLLSGAAMLAWGRTNGVGASFAQGAALLVAGLAFLPSAWRQLSLRRA